MQTSFVAMETRMFLVDFDWGGKVGEACYPTVNLHEELLANRTGSDLMISKDDDIRVHWINFKVL